VLLGNGDGTFQAPRGYSVGSGPRSVVVADLNGDGFVDVVTANYQSANVSVLINDGNWPAGPQGASPSIRPRARPDVVQAPATGMLPLSAASPGLPVAVLDAIPRPPLGPQSHPVGEQAIDRLFATDPTADHPRVFSLSRLDSRRRASRGEDPLANADRSLGSNDPIHS
jgi:hypothetical protein